jgi:hypothetical protein
MFRFWKSIGDGEVNAQCETRAGVDNNVRQSQHTFHQNRELRRIYSEQCNGQLACWYAMYRYTKIEALSTQAPAIAA